MNRYFLKVLVIISLVFGALLLPLHAASRPDDPQVDPLLDLDIESLMDIEVYSAAKKTQRLQNVSSAVFVINQEMIHNSGLTEIPEILRLAPGVQVSRINGSSWSISIRGGSGRYGDKLLVMIDGRSIYTPLFAGVYWEDQDLVLADIERIEVVRGPGAAVWGANAVNGVVNIITKNSADTQGTHVAVSTGTINNALASARYGGAIGEDAHYRVSLKYRNQSRLDLPTGSEGYDGLQIGHGSFRGDWTPSHKDNLSFQGAFYTGTVEENRMQTLHTPPYATAAQSDDDRQGWDLVGSWNHQLNRKNQIDLSLYFNNSERDSIYFSSNTNTWDLALQQQLEIGNRQQFVYGFRYRYTESDQQGDTNIFFRQDKRSDYLYSFFIQDEVALLSQELFLTLGSKFEYQSFTGFEVQPTVRLRWELNERNSLWAAVSRSVRSPSIAEQDIVVEAGYRPIPGDPPGLVGFWVLGNPDLDAETSIAYEAGYRTSLSPRVSMDLALFYNEYDQVRGFDSVPPVLTTLPIPHLRTGVQMANNISGDSYGFELSTDWRPINVLHFHANYSYLQVVVDDVDGHSSRASDEFEGRTPTSLFGFSANWDPRHDLTLGLYLYATSRLEYTREPISSSFRGDLRVAWRPMTGMELSLVGQNLFQSKHLEYPVADSLFNSEIPRSVHVGLSIDF
jgi:iron complex outermembrane receptor protein